MYFICFLYIFITSAKRRSSSSEVFYKMGVLENLQNSEEKICAEISFSIKFLPGGLQLYQNRDSDIGVFCEFCKIFKNSYFVEHLGTAASGKQQVNYRFNRKNGVTENSFNYLPKKMITKHKNVQFFLKILQNSHENTCAGVFFNKFAGLKPSTLFNKRLQQGRFPVNFVKFLIILFNQTPHNHYIHAKISTGDIQAFFWPTSKFYWPALPAPKSRHTSPTNPHYPRHPRYLADSFVSCFEEMFF